MRAWLFDSRHTTEGHRRSPRHGFTLTECAIALAVLATCAVIVAKLATETLADRSRLEARFEAEQIAANVLEQARAVPWDGLTPTWASERQLPPEVLQRWPNTRLVVRVESEPNRARVKRIVVEVRWEGEKFTKWPAVGLTALFAARNGGGGA
jgi:prepilin-type N-terminal cleavage/methylation domain-containing protein